MGRGIFRGDGRVHLLMPLIQQLDGGEPLGHRGAGAVELLLRQLDLSLLLDKVRLCLVDGALGLADQRLRLLQRSLKIPGIHIATTWPARTMSPSSTKSFAMRP